MRTVAKFALECAVDELSGAALADTVTALAERWLDRKGSVGDGGLFVLKDGRTARLTREASADQDCRSFHVLLSEPTAYGTFETSVTYGCNSAEFGFGCRLRTGASGQLLGPIDYEARVPGLVRDVVRLNSPWTFAGQPIPTEPRRMVGRPGGEEVAELITRVDRALPVVVVSEDNGFPLHPNLAQQLSFELVSLASVVSLDSEASWALTEAIGVRFSCFGGAVRLFWPGVDPAVTNSYNHPLWTPLRLMDGAANTLEAAERLCRALRRRVLGTSALTVQDPLVLSMIADHQRSARSSEVQRQLRDAEDYSKLAESYAEENLRLNEEVRTLEAEVRDLRVQLRNHQETLRHWHSGQAADEVLPEPEGAPFTVGDVVQRIRREFKGAIVFGEDVPEGIDGLHPEAGPPEKVYRYLQTLGEFARLRRRAPVGTSMLEWFKQRNVSASDEGENLSARERAARTWHDGVGRRLFVWHLKPAEAVAPDRCVRIYFEWDDEREVVVVGWVGRHP